MPSKISEAFRPLTTFAEADLFPKQFAGPVRPNGGEIEPRRRRHHPQGARRQQGTSQARDVREEGSAKVLGRFD